MLGNVSHPLCSPYHEPFILSPEHNEWPDPFLVIGCFVAGPAVAKYGHRYVLAATGVIGMIGVIVQATSKSYIQYFFGRIILYFVSIQLNSSTPSLWFVCFV